MNKLLTKIAGGLLGISLAVGVGVALGGVKKAQSASAGNVTDEITLSLTGVTAKSTSYSNWSGKTSNSNAVYAGNCNGGTSSVASTLTAKAP